MAGLWPPAGTDLLYEEPGEQERQDLEDARNRGRGENARRKRLKRGWQQLEQDPYFAPRTGG